MSRTPKKYINTPFFHIMVQGINKEPIFETSIEAEEYLKLIKASETEEIDPEEKENEKELEELENLAKNDILVEDEM